MASARRGSVQPACLPSDAADRRLKQALNQLRKPASLNMFHSLSFQMPSSLASYDV